MKNHAPRTQAAINAFADDEIKLQKVFDLCRLLEMELVAFKRNNHELITSHNAMADERNVLRAEVDQWAARCAAAIYMLPETVTGGQLREAQDKFHRERENLRRENAALRERLEHLQDFAVLVLRGLESGCICAKTFIDTSDDNATEYPVRTLEEIARAALARTEAQP